MVGRSAPSYGGLVPTPIDPVLTLQQAADELGVHYMTAYRYVRLGQLDAHKVGGSWQVTRAALDELIAGRRHDRPARHRQAPWSERLVARLVAGDEAGAWGVIEAALTGGMEIADVYADVLTPALRAIGDRWERGELDVAVEHRASVICGRLIGRLGPRCVRRGRRRGTIVVGAPAGERHALAVAVLADLLRLEGWDVSDLGADTPAGSFVLAASEVDDLAAIGISITDPEHLDAGAATCRALREAGIAVPLVVGGQAVTDDDHARRLGADRHAADAESFIAAIGSPGISDALA